MFGILAAVFTALTGFVSGNLTSVDNTKPVTTYQVNACYQPDPTQKITLKWSENFRQVTDQRPQLNPNYWGRANLPAKFDTDISCKGVNTGPMGGKDEKSFILIRKQLRIPSCKTDELAGPLTNKPPCSIANTNPVIENTLRPRGTCVVNYTTHPELRKVADAKVNGKKLEIFWNPFTHNVGCGYKKENGANCGPGDRSNINMADFIYVLKGRDAFAPDNTNPNCTPLLDAGPNGIDTCSHFFDVYIAEDLYNKCLAPTPTNSATPVPTLDPQGQCYFFNQVIQNCQEATIFMPLGEGKITFPPSFLSKPFMDQRKYDSDPHYYELGKIIPSASEYEIYKTYVWGGAGGTAVNPFTTNLLSPIRDGEIAGPFDFCPAEGGPSCLEALGKINLQDTKGTTVSFKVYSRRSSPETYTLIKIGQPNTNNTKSYVYQITLQEITLNNFHFSSLQLKTQRMMTQTDWTWGTPVCKPAIYLYPEKETDLNVKLKLSGELTKSEPAYSANSGWNVRAKPNGTLQLTTDNLQPTTYPYLYYEADIKGVTIPKEGWVIANENLKFKIENLLKQIGFNDKETSDFLSYWLPRLKEKPYYFVTFLPESVINQKEELVFSKTPDTLIRTRVVFEGLDDPISVAPLASIPSHTRHGFVVTDWGGTIVGESCTDVSVK